jgi:hypothetical protein
VSIHPKTRQDGSRVFTVRWREGGSNPSRTFDRRADAQAFESELRRRQQLGVLATQQLTERHGLTLGEWIEQRWAPEPRALPRSEEVAGQLEQCHPSRKIAGGGSSVHPGCAAASPARARGAPVRAALSGPVNAPAVISSSTRRRRRASPSPCGANLRELAG